MRKILCLTLALFIVLSSFAACGKTAKNNDKSDEKESTSKVITSAVFEAGNVKISLDEAPVDVNGFATEGNRVSSNSYTLMPGRTYDKDPTVHVAEDSEDCWLFVKVDNGIANIEANINTVAIQMANNGWSLIDGANGVYAYNAIAKAGDDIVVFNRFSIAYDATAEEIEACKGKKISVQAIAIQSDGFETAEEAWEKSGKYILG